MINSYLKGIVNSVISIYQNSEEYVKRCLLDIDKSICIDLEGKYINQGLLSIEYKELQKYDSDYEVILHISTDFVRDIYGNYDFSSLIYIPYKFSIDEFGKFWDLEKYKIKNLLSSLLSCFNRISLNINLSNCILYEYGVDKIYNDVLKQHISNYINKMLKRIKSYLPSLKDSTIYFVGFNNFDCLNLLDIIDLEKNGIHISIENFILELGNEINLEEFASEISILNYYLDNTSSVSIYLFDFIFLDIRYEQNNIFKLLGEICELIRNQKLNINMTSYVTFSFLLGTVEFPVGYYNKFREELKVYEDVLNFDYFDTYLGMNL